MTNSEAIAVLMEHKRYVHENSVPDQALDMGIKALKNERKKGKWVLINDNNGQHYICKFCGEWKYHQKQNYCGHCGADMREEKSR